MPRPVDEEPRPVPGNAASTDCALFSAAEHGLLKGKAVRSADEDDVGPGKRPDSFSAKDSLNPIDALPRQLTSERGNVSNEDVTPMHKASLKQAVTETPNPHVTHEGTPSHTAPLQVEKAVTEMHDSKTKKGSATSYVMDEDIFKQKVWELVDEDSRDNILAFLKKRRKLDPVCSEEELQTDGFIAKVLEFVMKHERHAFIARLEVIAREREAEETTEESDDSISEDPKDECEMDWTAVGRGGRAKSCTKNGGRGRGGRGPRGRHGK